MNSTQITAKIEELKARKNRLIENSADTSINQRNAYRAEIAEIEEEIDRLITDRLNAQEEENKTQRFEDYLGQTIKIEDWTRGFTVVRVVGTDWGIEVFNDSDSIDWAIARANNFIDCQIVKSTPRTAAEQTTTASDETTLHVNSYVQQTLKANHYYTLSYRHGGLLGASYLPIAKFYDCVAVTHFELLSIEDQKRASAEYEQAYKMGLHWTQVKI